MSDYREVHEQARAAGVARRNETCLERAMDRAIQTARAEVRRQVAEEIAWAITEAGDKRSPDRHSENEEKRDHGSTRYASYLDAARIAREIGSKETS